MKYATYTWDLELEILYNNWNTFQLSEMFYPLQLIDFQLRFFLISLKYILGWLPAISAWQSFGERAHFKPALCRISFH